MKKTKINCCKKPIIRNSKEDLGHAESMEYVLFQCESCGKHWLNVFCVASAISEFEYISEADVQAVLSLPKGPQQKAFMKEWGYKNLN
jgi:hypothetical protein